MAHFAENAPVWRGDAFHTEDGAVRVEMNIRADVPLQVDILCGNLSVGSKRTDQFLACEEAPLTVGNWDTVDLSNLSERQPGGFVRGNARAYNAGLVPPDSVKC